MFRSILGVIIAYAIFAVSAVLFFKLAGQDPHEVASMDFQIGTAFWGIFFSVISGWVLQIIAQTKSLTINYVLAAIIAGFAAFSMIKSAGSHWTQIEAIVLFAPASILGGTVYLNRKKHK